MRNGGDAISVSLSGSGLGRIWMQFGGGSLGRVSGGAYWSVNCWRSVGGRLSMFYFS